MDLNFSKYIALGLSILLSFFKVNVAVAEQWFYFDPIKVEAIIDFDGSYRRDNNSNKAKDTNWRAGLRLNQSFFILDPGIALFSLSFQPSYAWQDFQYDGEGSSAAQDENFSGRVMSYAVEATLGRDMIIPFQGNLFATKNSNINTGSLGSRYQSDSTIWGVNLHWENPAFPMNFRFDQIDFVQTNLSGSRGRLTERNELIKRWSINGKSSKTRFDFEHQDLDDRVEGRNQSYVTDNINLDHSLAWGRDSRLRSRISYYDRSGFNSNELFRLEENAMIYHTGKVSSNARYRFSTGGQNIKSDTHFGEYRLTHKLYNNLRTYIRAASAFRESSGFKETIWQTELGSQYQKQDFFGANVNAGFSINYGETDRDSSRLLVEVLDESHNVPVNGFVLLDKRFVIASTIIVTDATGVVVYVEGLDYLVSEEANNLTQLRILPGGRITIGDTILVSYKALALPSQEYSTTINSYNLGISLGWLNASHTRRTLDNDLISGASEFFLQDDLSDTTNIQFQWKMAKVNANVSATRSYRELGDYESNTYAFSQSLAWQFKGSQWTLVLLESFTETEDRSNDIYNLTLSTAWRPFSNLSIQSRLGFWKTIDEQSLETNFKLEDFYASFGVNLLWQYRKVSLNLDYQHNQRSTSRQNSSSRETVDDRLAFKLIRKF